MGIVLDVLEMLSDSLGDGNLHLADAQGLHKGSSIVVGTVCSAETWHGDANDAMAVVAQFVEGAHTDKERQRGVKTTADADDQMLALGMYKALGQTCCLDVENLLAGVGHFSIRGYEGMWIDGAHQLERMLGKSWFTVNNASMGAALGIDECGVGVTLSAQSLVVDLCRLQLGLERVAVTLDE
jgi:hypothetical protein